jgi:hypothetical protein
MRDSHLACRLIGLLSDTSGLPLLPLLPLLSLLPRDDLLLGKRFVYRVIKKYKFV